MTLLLASITSNGLQSALDDIELALDQGADGVELRIDLMPDLNNDDVAALCHAVPAGSVVVLTLRTRAEGGGFDGDETDRVSRMIELGPLFTHVDFEFEQWNRSANIQQKVMLAVRRAKHASVADGREEVEHAGRRHLILSRHFVRERPQRLAHVLLSILQEPRCDVAKLAWSATSIRDSFEALELSRDAAAAGHSVIVTCMGTDHLASRVLSRKCGAFATFAAVAGDRSSAPGQPTVRELIHRYRWHSINSATEVYGIVGEPVAHSLSPVVHNAAFAATGQNAVYLPFAVRAGPESFKAFVVDALSRPWLTLRGLSVTAPHKINAFDHCVAHGVVDDTARRIGAVNTIKFVPEPAEGGVRIEGSNTDAAAIVDAIERAAEGKSIPVSSIRVLVLGAGGVARAAVAGLTERGVSVTITARRPDAAAALAAEFGAAHCTWEQREAIDCSVVINCTPVGQSPDRDSAPIQVSKLRNVQIVVDTVYSPRQTVLLQQAESIGMAVVGGIEIFMAQAERQFATWTGIDAPSSDMHSAISAAVVGE